MSGVGAFTELGSGESALTVDSSQVAQIGLGQVVGFHLRDQLQDVGVSVHVVHDLTGSVGDLQVLDAQLALEVPHTETDTVVGSHHVTGFVAETDIVELEALLVPIGGLVHLDVGGGLSFSGFVITFHADEAGGGVLLGGVQTTLQGALPLKFDGEGAAGAVLFPVQVDVKDGVDGVACPEGDHRRGGCCRGRGSQQGHHTKAQHHNQSNAQDLREYFFHGLSLSFSLKIF